MTDNRVVVRVSVITTLVTEVEDSENDAEAIVKALLKLSPELQKYGEIVRYDVVRRPAGADITAYLDADFAANLELEGGPTIMATFNLSDVHLATRLNALAAAGD